MANRTCEIQTNIDCTSAGGEYQGNNTTCNNDPCLLRGFANPSFETGDLTDWTNQDLMGPFFDLQAVGVGTMTGFPWPWSSTPTDGSFTAFHGFSGTTRGSPITLAQVLTINDAGLTFDWRAGWDLNSAFFDRVFAVVIRIPGGAELSRVNILTAAAGTANLDFGLQSSLVDLSSFLGDTVQVGFEWTISEDGAGSGQFQLDNVCLSPLGACCAAGGSCVTLTQDLCAAQGDAFCACNFDVNADGEVNITDVAAVTNCSTESNGSACVRSCDVNCDGSIDLCDASLIHNALFVGGLGSPQACLSTPVVGAYCVEASAVSCSLASESFCLAGTLLTNPTFDGPRTSCDDPDDDGDGVPNFCDVCEGFDDKVDTDGDGAPDGCDACAGGAASGDSNANGSRDRDDYADFIACFFGPGGGLGVGGECFDDDADSDVDIRDFAAFQAAFGG